jgi:hypothetical protein
MSRLPNVGGDQGNWGTVLNDYLSVEHNADGTLKTVPVGKGGTGAVDAATARTNLGAVSTSDSRLTDARSPTTHAGSHSPGGGDALAFGAINLSGTLVARPAAAAANAGLLYFATDDNGGTMYRSDGSAWTKVSAAASALMTWKGAWGAGVPYVINDVVSYAGSSWIAIQAGTNQTPGIGSLYWNLTSQAGQNGTNEIVVASNTAGFSTSSTTFVDITGLSIAPATTSPIVLELSGLLQVNQVVNTNAQINCQVMIVDDTATTIGLQSRSIFFPTGGATGVDITQQTIRLHVTPNSVARTYKAQMRILTASASAAFFGTVIVGDGNALRFGAYLR